MGKYTKRFATHSLYTAFKSGSDYLEPNVSVCDDNLDVHYNIYVDNKIIVKFNITDTSSATNIVNSSAVSQFSKIEIDNVAQPSVVASYTFSTTGEHTIKYTLIDPTIIAANTFRNCSNIISIRIPSTVITINSRAFSGTGITTITIPDNVTTIGNYLFSNCSNLTNITIGSGITTLDSYFAESTGLISIIIPANITLIKDCAFLNCTNLTSVTVERTSAPGLMSNVFFNTNSCPIYVPAESVNSYKSNWSNYASRIQAIPS